MTERDWDVMLTESERNRITNVKVYAPDDEKVDLLVGLSLIELSLISFEQSTQVFQTMDYLALTLEYLALTVTVSTPDFFNGITFLHLRHLKLAAWYDLDAPSLTRLDLDGIEVDLTQVYTTYPRITTLSLNECTPTNLTALTKLSLEHLELIKVDGAIDTSTLNLITLVTDMTVSFPKTLRHLTCLTDTIDLTAIKRLHLTTLHVHPSIPTVLTRIRLSLLHTLELHNCTLTDAFFIDGANLTRLILSDCVVTYTDVIQAPVLEVSLIRTTATDFIPTTVVKLELSECSGEVMNNLSALTRLKQVSITSSRVQVRSLRKLPLVKLDLVECNLTQKDLKYVSRINTLRDLNIRGSAPYNCGPREEGDLNLSHNPGLTDLSPLEHLSLVKVIN